MKIQINLPQFPGFYDTHLDIDFHLEGQVGNDKNCHVMSEAQYDNIDWKKTNENVAKDYLDWFTRETAHILPEIGIKDIQFVEVDSPKYYNFSTDKLVCNVSYSLSVFKKACKEYINKNSTFWYQFLRDNFTSYSGFISFYSNDVFEWERLLETDLREDNVVFETFLEFILLCEVDITNYDLDSYFELIEYKTERE